MALTPTQIARAWKDFTDDLYRPEGALSCKFTKGDLAAAVAATDTWIDANQASFNAALPQPFRTTATTTEKTALFNFVALRRLRG